MDIHNLENESPSRDETGLGLKNIQNESASRSHHRVKRKRGGQKGNQNARKHGFYSRELTLAEAGEFWNITGVEGVKPEIAFFRLKFRALLQRYPENRRTLADAVRLLVKLLRSRYQLDGLHACYLKKVIRAILTHHLAPSLKNILTKPIERTLPVKLNPE